MARILIKRKRFFLKFLFLIYLSVLHTAKASFDFFPLNFVTYYLYNPSDFILYLLLLIIKVDFILLFFSYFFEKQTKNSTLSKKNFRASQKKTILFFSYLLLIIIILFYFSCCVTFDKYYKNTKSNSLPT